MPRGVPVAVRYTIGHTAKFDSRKDSPVSVSVPIRGVTPRLAFAAMANCRGQGITQWRRNIGGVCRGVGIANTELDKGGQLKAAGDILGAGGTLASAKEFVAVRWVRCGYALHE